jgi:hypothetical protein
MNNESADATISLFIGCPLSSELSRIVPVFNPSAGSKRSYECDLSLQYKPSRLLGVIAFAGIETSIAVIYT